MPRLLHNGRWFESLHPAALYELSFEALIAERGLDLFPDYICVRFNKLVTSELGSGRADLALIERHYRRWYVVEVELASHSLAGHVQPQIQRLAAARYGDDEAIWLSERNPSIDARRLQRLLATAAPDLLVIANAPVPHWQQALVAAGAKLSIVELYRSQDNRLILSVDGEGPEPSGPTLSSIEIGSDWFRSMLRVLHPAALPAHPRPSLHILYRDHAIEVRVREIGDATYLKPTGYDVQFPEGWRGTLIRRSDGWLEFVDTPILH